MHRTFLSALALTFAVPAFAAGRPATLDTEQSGAVGSPTLNEGEIDDTEPADPSAATGVARKARKPAVPSKRIAEPRASRESTADRADRNSKRAIGTMCDGCSSPGARRPEPEIDTVPSDAFQDAE